MIEIPLSKGQIALVSDSDYHLVSDFKWFAIWVPEVGTYYAVRKSRSVPANKRVYIWMHRQIAAVPDLPWVDHWDRNGLNNQRYNLRPCTVSQNLANAKIYKSNTLGVKGVTRRGAKYQARINFEKRSICLGTYHTKEEAAEAYIEAAVRLYGEFARAS